MSNFQQYSGTGTRVYPSYDLTVAPNDVIDFGVLPVPSDGFWSSHAGPATHGFDNANVVVTANVTVINQRLVGTTSGAPTTGTWNANDVVTDLSGAVFVCTVGGTPGTWKLANSATYVMSAHGDAFASLCRWAPPPQINPTVYNATGNFQAITAGPNEDVIVYGKTSAAATGSLNITGGRHIRVIGGKWAKTTTGGSIRVISATGSVFVEGVEIDASGYNGDAINACGVQSGTLTYPDVYIQNCRIYGVNGTQATNHADIYQPQGPVGRVFIDKLTGSSNYQGIFVTPQYAVTEVHLSRVNLTKVVNTDQPITYLIWLAGTADVPVPYTFDETYVSLPAGQTLYQDGVAPYDDGSGGQTSTATGISGTKIAAIDDGSGNAYWPAVMKTSGKVWKGSPSAGDFVPSGLAGLTYVSKGYQTAAPSVVVSPHSWESLAGLCYTGDPSTQSAGVAAWPSANRMIWMRVQGGNSAPAKYRINVGTSSGNIRIVTCPNSGTGPAAAPSGTFTNDTGNIVCPATGIQTVTISTPTVVNDGDWIGLWCDNTTATFSKFSSALDATMTAGRIAAQSAVGSGTTAPASLFGATQCFYVAVE